MKQATILAVGMLPPPIGGQALMFKRAVDALQEHYDLKVIDIQFQNNLGESGSFSVRKVLHFFALLFGKIVPLVFTKKFDVLYYCLSGPSTLGLIKDLIFLGLLRSRQGKRFITFTALAASPSLCRVVPSFAPGHGSSCLSRIWYCVRRRPSMRLHCAKPDAGLLLIIALKIRLQWFSKSARKWPNVELSFAFVGLVTEDKGVFDLVEIARLLRDRGHRFTMSIVGEGVPEEIARLKELICRYDLAEFVRLTGVLIGEQKFELLQQTTIFLFPTYFRAETQPTAIMEALAVGVPAVAYDWRGINTIIDQGVNGYLVPLRDVDAFCRAIEQILTGGKIDDMRRRRVAFFLNDLRSTDTSRRSCSPSSRCAWTLAKVCDPKMAAVAGKASILLLFSE